MAYQRRWETRGERRRGGGPGRGSANDGGRDSVEDGRSQDGNRQRSQTPARGYYGIAPIHRAHWKWLVIWYFFLGGIASASYALASIADLLAGPDTRRIARYGRYLSLATFLPCPPLLILDLGRPERFLYMLRVIKLRSPMSLGSWAIAVFGAFSTLSAAIQAAQDGVAPSSWIPDAGRKRGEARISALLAGAERLLCRLPARLIGAAGMVVGFFVGGYTGVLLAITAVPLWTRNYLLLGPLFLASAMSNATAALTLIFALRGGPRAHGTLHLLERMERVALLAELILLVRMQGNLGPILGRPLARGRLSRLFRGGVLEVGIAAPLALQAPVLPRPRALARVRAGLAAIATLAGGFTFRYVIVMAGHASAGDPEATFTATHQAPAAAPQL